MAESNLESRPVRPNDIEDQVNTVVTNRNIIALFLLLCSVCSSFKAQTLIENMTQKQKDSLIVALNKEQKKPYNDLDDTMKYISLTYDINRNGFKVGESNTEGIHCSKEYIVYKFVNKAGRASVEHYTATKKLLEKGFLEPIGPFRERITKTIVYSSVEVTRKTVVLNENTYYLEKDGALANLFIVPGKSVAAKALFCYLYSCMSHGLHLNSYRGRAHGISKLFAINNIIIIITWIINIFRT